MYICVTHVDASTGVPCTEAPMRRGPSFPKVKGLRIEWANYTQWPTDTPYFYGVCDEDADVEVLGVIKILTEQQYNSMRQTETDNKAGQVRMQRDSLLLTEVDTYNPMRWELLTEEQKNALRDYRKALLDVPQQEGFPWSVTWPTKPE